MLENVFIDTLSSDLTILIELDRRKRVQFNLNKIKLVAFPINDMV